MDARTSKNRRVLEVEGLSVAFGSGENTFRAVKSLDLHVDRGETLAIVGESGSGKSVTSLAVMRLVEFGGGRIESGRITLHRASGEAVDIVAASEDSMRAMRGNDLGMIFQEPMTSLNPVFTVGAQIIEAIRLHQPGDVATARAQAIRILDQVRIPGASAMLGRYPHELSGGMRQRVMIAMALSCKPTLLIADEPTTALDVTIQAQILQLIRELQHEMDMGVIFITHDMGVVAEVADRVMVMRKGDVVENNDVHGLFKAPKHPYTKALMAAVPRLGAMRGTTLPARFPLLSDTEQKEPPPAVAAKPDVVLSVRDLTTRFDVRGGMFARVKKRVHAVEQVSFDLHAGETLALVGESGCGKTSTGRSLLRLAKTTRGTIVFEGRAVNPDDAAGLRLLRRHMQFVFQDPFASLNPRMRVGDCVKEPMIIQGLYHGAEADRRAAELFERVGLDASMLRRWPHEFSGGQRQRICIARALSVNPKVLIADESVSALDVSIQAQIVNLLIDLQRDLGISLLFISHDMAVVERISHRVAVMYLGQIVEIGPRQAIFENPQHAYTRKLMQAVPIADPGARRGGSLELTELPSPVRAVGDEPEVLPLVQVGEGHFVARHRIGGAY
ncbi:dipeptide ABC transporter ATP-binding protein [Bordetella sp. 02P26C-1]|uniref:dipeptide ABC transporter ATP-binding protein n=1 Tax=Bordetella sp. 02P26C-1 TaxID=2683195 RepID=UPI0013543504|nr:dipeptide ABC transporter ATP-binding protein [Bordetella sp. 02P26C-1]MVW80153.1 dipeptide ABC transporter ATP-binding protein [Bordetella sp. 02P26C-1]